MTPDDVLRYCLENPDNLSTEQLLARFPEQRDEIQKLLSLDSSLKSTLSQPLPKSSPRSLQDLIAASASAKSDRPRLPEAANAGRPVQPIQNVPAARPRALWPRRSLWALASVAALVLLVWGLSANALADSPFYTVKIATENEILTFSRGAEAQARGHIDLATNRLYDLRAMQSQGKLGQAQTAFNNYIYHFKSSVDVWHGSNGAGHTNLGKLLYVSSVVGQRTFRGISTAASHLPALVQTSIDEIVPDLDSLNSSAGQELQADGIDLDALLRDADSRVVSLLTPIPGVVFPTDTPTTTPTPEVTATALITPTPSPEPCLDAYEGDGVPEQARVIAVGETQRHTLCPAGDADWLKFQATAGSGYSIETLQLSPGVNTYIYLFDTDGKTLIGSNNDAPDALASSPIVFYAKRDGWYYFQIKNHGEVGSGETSYSVSLLAASATATPTPLIVESP